MSSEALAPYVGTHFIERGRSRDGVDCWGLIYLLYREVLGITLPSYADRYQTTTDQEALASIISGEMQPWHAVERGKEVFGDVILFRLPNKRGRWPSHVGFVIQPETMIHCEVGTETALGWYDQSFRGSRWNNRIVGIYRYEARL